MYDYECKDGEFIANEPLNQTFEYDGIVYEYRMVSKVYVLITSWRGISFGATHWYCKLQFATPKTYNVETGEESQFWSSAFPKPKKYEHSDEIEITYIRKSHLVERDGNIRYRKGEHCGNFENLEHLYERVEEELKRILKGDWEIHWHDRAIYCKENPCKKKNQEKELSEEYGELR